ncbi:HNH endonuclease [Mycolicibacterium sp. TY66]|uniref:HNH endonuclease n=1 Tax=unclassified Mycolicibacterium TaxID=2636767 RepID=UPI001BB31237|nr:MULTISPECIES: HNH endonuclease signature motif containing protein [unclassified Mycolicibacterium]BCI79078.1 HNH endonuclease [Mycolicibacterium sp. TY66]BCJ83261.1 HNH endonuclease [Mycolicibacterium sp. TY81]
MGIAPDLTTSLDTLRGVQVPDDVSAGDVLEALPYVVKLRNVIDHLAAMLTGVLDRCGVASSQGRSPREVLMALGCAPSVAQRLVRVSGALPALPTLAAHAADGAISGEHVDAIVKGINHIQARAPGEVDEAARFAQVTDLLGQFFSGATPADIDKRARRLGNRHAAAEGGLPAAEDRSINTADHRITSDGRVQIRADLDAEVGAKYIAAMEQGSAPRPEPDGSPDTRTAGRRRADALETVLDIAARGGHTASAPRTQLLVTVPADTPDLATLEFIGSISTMTLERLTCDTTVTTIIVDGEHVPLDMGREKRLFPPHLRKALYLRDQCCIKCGAPPGRTHAHHIIHWTHHGETSLANGCLLCPACHANVHHDGWDVVMGLDKHPWLIPPETVDPHRKPIPAHNRRTMHLDHAA